jgi:hypothetical protein
MVLRHEPDGSVIAIGQPAHAWISGQLARAWGNDAFGHVEPAEEVCLAAEQHDVGMALYDLEPRLDPDTGLPYPFDAMPFPAHLELWEAAPRRLLAQSRYAALLVSMHGEALYRMRDPNRLPPEQAARVRAYLEEQGELQRRLADDLRRDPRTAPAAAPERLRRNQRLLWTWDFLSLALCLRWAPRETSPTPTAREPVALELAPIDDRRFTLRPWPFADAKVAVRTEGRRLVGRFDDEPALHAALAGVEPVTLEFELSAEPRAASSGD